MTNTDDQKLIQHIIDVAESLQIIPVSQVKEWLVHPSLDVQGVVTRLISKDSSRITPELSFEEKFSAFQNYYRRCLIQNVESLWVPNRYLAGYEIASWFNSLWEDSSVPREYLMRLKAMLRDLYLENEDLREVIVNAVLEHLFETPEIANFFKDWRADPTLSNPFALAMEWSEKSPNK
jgi:hypothetical protein